MTLLSEPFFFFVFSCFVNAGYTLLQNFHALCSLYCLVHGKQMLMLYFDPAGFAKT